MRYLNNQESFFDNTMSSHQKNSSDCTSKTMNNSNFMEKPNISSFKEAELNMKQARQQLKPPAVQNIQDYLNESANLSFKLNEKEGL